MTKEQILNTRLTEEQIAMFYLGQEGFLIRYRDHFYLIDPYLSDSIDRHHGMQDADWTRRYDIPILPEELDFVDYVFCTHDHTDHADPDTLRALAAHNTKAVFIVPEPIRKNICSYGVDDSRIMSAAAGQKLSLGPCSVTPVAAAHEELHTDASGNYKELGYRMTFGGTTLFHSGDCCIYNGLAEQIDGVDILMVPVNGRDYYKLRNNIIGNMNAEEAVLLAQEIHARLLVPMHFDLYAGNGLSPAYFVDCLYRFSPGQAFHMFAPGERYIF